MSAPRIRRGWHRGPVIAFVVAATALTGSLAWHRMELLERDSRSEAEAAAARVADRVVEDLLAASSAEPPPWVDLAHHAFDTDGRAVEADALVPSIPASEWAAGAAAEGAPTGVAVLGPVVDTRNMRRLFVLKPSQDAGSARVGVSLVVDSLMRRAGAEALDRRGWVSILTLERSAGPRAIASRGATELSDPVVVRRVAPGGTLRLSLAPPSGWSRGPGAWAPVLIGLLLALYGAYGLSELLEAPERTLDRLRRLRGRMRALRHQLLDETRRREAAEARLSHQSQVDAVTGLPTRARLVRALERALRDERSAPGSGACVLHIGLDRFEEVRDSLGEGAAEDLQAAAARVLADTIRPEDIVAAAGSGQFAALMRGVSDGTAANEAAGRVSSALDRVFAVQGLDIHASGSIGVTLLQSGLESAGELLNRAEAAMREAVRVGPGRIVTYDPTLIEGAARNILIRTDLRPALAREEFVPVYQPIVELATRLPIGMEMLVRWTHPKEGPISPGVFIPIAEEDGFIVRLNRWLADRAADQLASWRRSGVVDDDFYVTINLSGRDLEDAQLADVFADRLEHYGLPHGSLRVEVTERILPEDVDQAADNLARLRDVGIPLLLDDFGTGYSSLALLHRFPFDTMKIDGSFVIRMTESERDRATMEAIVRLAHALGMTTVAEGIEEAELVELLEAAGCYSVQGYFFSRPAPADEAIAEVERLREAAGARERAPA